MFLLDERIHRVCVCEKEKRFRINDSGTQKREMMREVVGMEEERLLLQTGREGKLSALLLPLTSPVDTRLACAPPPPRFLGPPYSPLTVASVRREARARKEGTSQFRFRPFGLFCLAIGWRSRCSAVPAIAAEAIFRCSRCFSCRRKPGGGGTLLEAAPAEASAAHPSRDLVAGGISAVRSAGLGSGGLSERGILFLGCRRAGTKAPPEPLGHLPCAPCARRADGVVRPRGAARLLPEEKHPVPQRGRREAESHHRLQVSALPQAGWRGVLFNPD